MIDEAAEVAPKADFYRCHGLYDSHWLQKEMKDRGFKFCSNRCEWWEQEPRERLNAVGLLDIPIWWEDSIEFRGWNTICDAHRGNEETYIRDKGDVDGEQRHDRWMGKW